MQFKKKVLKNGLTVLHEERDVPVSTVMLACKFGSAFETAAEKGIAHFLEHLHFKGTNKRTAREISFEIEKLGGDLNAFTHEEVTAYHAKLPSTHLGVAMDVLFDLYFNAALPESEIKKEAKVICEEIKMYNDNPRSFVLNKIKENLFEAPFGLPIIGNEKNVLSFTREDFLKVKKKYYSPENTILCVVGKNSFEEVMELIEKHTLDIPKFEKAKRNNVTALKKNAEFLERRKNLSQASVAIGFHFPLASSKERYAAEVFSSVLGEGMSSKLFTEVREKRGLVYTVRSELDLGTQYGYLIIYAGTDDSNIEQVTKISLEEFHKMIDLTSKELEEGKEQLIGSKNVRSEVSENVALELVLGEIHGDAKEYYHYEQNIRKVSLKEIQNLAKNSVYSRAILSVEKQNSF